MFFVIISFYYEKSYVIIISIHSTKSKPVREYKVQNKKNNGHLVCPWLIHKNISSEAVAQPVEGI